MKVITLLYIFYKQRKDLMNLNKNLFSCLKIKITAKLNVYQVFKPNQINLKRKSISNRCVVMINFKMIRHQKLKDLSKVN